MGENPLAPLELILSHQHGISKQEVEKKGTALSLMSWYALARAKHHAGLTGWELPPGQWTQLPLPPELIEAEGEGKMLASPTRFPPSSTSGSSWANPDRRMSKEEAPTSNAEQSGEGRYSEICRRLDERCHRKREGQR